LHGRIGADDEAGRGLVELNGQRAFTEIHLEVVVVGSADESFVEFGQRVVGVLLKILIVHYSL
jgi:hypothetical protein